jgi:uncharacterized protein
MNKRLLDILVCPFDKVTSLELLEFETGSQRPYEAVNNEQSLKRESGNSSIVKEGLLLCKTCNRFYPITEEIPIILPDELRDKKKDIEFLKKWKEVIPGGLLPTLKPWTI